VVFPHFTRNIKGVETCALRARALHLNSAGGPPNLSPSMEDILRGETFKAITKEMKGLKSSSINNIHDFLQGESNCYFFIQLLVIIKFAGVCCFEKITSNVSDHWLKSQRDVGIDGKIQLRLPLVSTIKFGQRSLVSMSSLSLEQFVGIYVFSDDKK